MKVINNIFRSGKFIIAAILLTVLTASCGKSSEVNKTDVKNSTDETEIFAAAFFTEYNLPYQQLKVTDVENTADEYLFYIPNGQVYRTLNDCSVVIVKRSEIRETEEQSAKNYSGELYNIFEDNDIDVLKYSACGDFAIMCSLSSIPNWDENEVISGFMEFAKEYKL
ncbi:MAG: hypothetical protein ACI4IJ_08795 [Acutalibacteraceae bacterium]